MKDLIRKFVTNWGPTISVLIGVILVSRWVLLGFSDVGQRMTQMESRLTVVEVKLDMVLDGLDVQVTVPAKVGGDQ